VGLTDPEGPLARQVREAFHESPLSISRFVPLGTAEQDGRLSEIDGEAEFLRTPSRETVGDLDFLILAGSAADPECRRLAAESGVPAYDLEQTPLASLGCAAVLETLHPLPFSAVFTVLLPASEAGTPGIEELFGQAGDSLNFRPTEAPVFGSRLAFNVFRDPSTESLETAVTAALERRFTPCAVSVLGARIGIFHGYAASAQLRFSSESDARAAVRQLRETPGLSVGEAAGTASTAAAVEDSRVLLDPPIQLFERVSFWFAFDGLALASQAALAAALDTSRGPGR
jgi:hypothetical protein